MKQSWITYAPILAALVAVGCGDNTSNKPASDPSMARTTSAPSPESTTPSSSYGSTPTSNGTSTTSSPTMTPQPSTAQPSTAQPSTAQPSTAQPSTTAGTMPSDGMNESGRSNTPTAMDQGNDATDTRITADIRKAVVADAALSFMAKNVTIITNGTRVVLRGTVKTAAERREIELKARGVAGVSDVSNEIQVKK